MRHALLLAFRYMAFYRMRSAIMVVCLSISIFLPAAVHLLVDYYNRIMVERADATPLVIGAKGSAYDLVLNTLYFKGRLQQRLSMQQVRSIDEGGLATAVPVYVRFTAGEQPIVGTTLDYFRFRELEVRQGTLPQVLGDVVLGATAANRLGLGVGDKLLSDQEKLYDISSSYPLLLHVVGILEETSTADDLVIFADIKTTWIIEGIGHGHTDARNLTDPTMFRAFSEGNVVMSGAVVQYNEITPEALDRFHFHGDQAEFPLTAVIALPHDAKAATMLAARYRRSESAQAVVPRKVVEEMMDIVFLVKRFFDMVFMMVVVSATLFLVLVMLLSWRIRSREFQTLQKIGCSRSTVFAIQAGEIVLLLAVSFAIAAAMLVGLMWYVTRYDVLL